MKECVERKRVGERVWQDKKSGREGVMRDN